MQQSFVCTQRSGRRRPSRGAQALGVLLFSTAASAQVVVYGGGDGVTTVVRGTPLCGTTALALNDLDGTSYSVTSATESALAAPVALASIPQPMGERNSGVFGGPWGVTLVNPLGQPLPVTIVGADGMGTRMFAAVQGVKPATGWTWDMDTAWWLGAIQVPPRSALDFVFRVSPA